QRAAPARPPRGFFLPPSVYRSQCAQRRRQQYHAPPMRLQSPRQSLCPRPSPMRLSFCFSFWFMRNKHVPPERVTPYFGLKSDLAQKPLPLRSRKHSARMLVEFNARWLIVLMQHIHIIYVVARILFVGVIGPLHKAQGASIA